MGTGGTVGSHPMRDRSRVKADVDTGERKVQERSGDGGI